MQYKPFSPMWILQRAVFYLPSLIALVYGVVLCLRHRHRKPQTAFSSGTAIWLLVASAAPEVIMAVAFWIGFRLPRGAAPVPFQITIIQSLLLALGLALLLRTAYFDETPVEYDPSPPVYRNDDGPPAAG